MKNQNQKKEKRPSQGEYPEYVKYIGLAFQMCAIIGLGTWIGWKIQENSPMNFPVWLLLCCFISIAVAFYSLFISLKK
ncbi:ATPase F0F1 [Echinicola strongylocentroti]|uniref:ATPase F0F1 n=1 Tax=Echinicola strongylocentroti TaxID=1795355 RepID=A0A2Z4IIE7_9BACT|nr:AtpZ/AtpI family protein [Echinicola strongylocentroti]AWW30326.1 ATPase F0F1 [Echinicola strongylocentroti]